ncbi:MAG: right-handed parallel beta-helix repeat-containing protein, partial [Acidobacteria bacterium]|nr:right-handed parallel beta-helix repeat-containing protein [Acidobacteriota bacterium]
LVDAVTDAPVVGHDPLGDGAAVDLAELTQSDQLSVVANVDPATEGLHRVRFDLDGQVNFRVEALAPYTLFGDSGTNINGGSLSVGIHSLTVRATDSSGTLIGDAYSLSFEITDSTGGGGGGGGGGGTELGPLPANTQDLFDALTGTVAYVDGNGGSDANPCTATSPCATLAEGMTLLNGGVVDNLVVRGGSEENPVVYREAVTISRSGVTILGYPGEVAILNGLVPASSGWTQSGNLYWRTYTTSLWEHPMASFEAHYGFPQKEKAPEMVVVDGEPLLTVYAKADLVAGSFWREGTAASPTKLWARFPGDLPPSSFGSVEVGDKPVLLTTRGQNVSGVTVAGLNLMYGPNSADSDTVQGGIFDTASSSNSTFRDLTVMWANGVGVSLYGDSNTFLRVRAIKNGQLGFHGNLRTSTVTDSSAIANNWKGFQARWEAGGAKLTASTLDNVIERFYSANNDGPGMWFDVGPKRNVVRDSKFLNNQFVGFFFERTTDSFNRLENSVVFGTRLHQNVLHPENVDGSGIHIQATGFNTVESCTIYSNEGDGISINLPDGDGSNRENKFFDNLLVNNGLGGALGNPKDYQFQILCDAASAFVVDTLTLDGNLYWDQPAAGDEIFQVSCKSGAGTSSLATWINQTPSVNEALLNANLPVLEDETSPDGYTVVGAQAAGKGAALSW